MDRLLIRPATLPGSGSAPVAGQIPRKTTCHLAATGPAKSRVTTTNTEHQPITAIQLHHRHSQPNQTVAASPDGHVDLWANVAGDAIIDIVGYITGPTTPASMDGIFIAQAG